MTWLWRLLFEEHGWGKVWTGLGMAIALAGGGLVYQQTRPGSTSGTANLWIDTNGGTCTRQSTAGAYSDAGACSSLNAAYQAASCGDTVLIKAGTYSSSQTISSNAGLSGCSSRVVYDEASGETASFTNSVDIDRPAAHIELRNLDITPFINLGWNSSASTDVRVRDIILQNIDVQSFHIMFVDGVTWTGGDVGPADADGTPVVEHPWIGEVQTGSTDWAAKNVTIQGVAFHDIFASADTNHTECLLITTSDNVNIIGNTFTHCDSTGAIYATEFNDAAPNGYCLDLTIENNFFYDNSGGSGPVIQDDCETTFSFNTMATNAGLSLERWTSAAGGDGCGPSGGAGGNCTVNIWGNYGKLEGCDAQSNFVFRDNVWLGLSCHASDLNVGSFNVVSDTSNLHLSSSSANAVDQGYATYPATDIDGDNRFLGAGPDAGADEKG